MEASVSSSDFRYDPENIIPDNIPPLPVGTLAEIQAEGLDPAVVPTCGKPVRNGNEVVVRGCPYRHVCKLAIRDESGPRNFGVRYIKGKALGGKTVIGERNCFYIALNKDVIEENEGSLTIVAHEGETYKTIEAGPHTGYKDQIVEKVVTPFPRPGQNPDLAMEQLKAIVRSEEKARMSKEQEHINIGGVVDNGLKTRKPKS